MMQTLQDRYTWMRLFEGNWVATVLLGQHVTSKSQDIRRKDKKKQQYKAKKQAKTSNTKKDDGDREDKDAKEEEEDGEDSDNKHTLPYHTHAMRADSGMATSLTLALSPADGTPIDRTETAKLRREELVEMIQRLQADAARATEVPKRPDFRGSERKKRHSADTDSNLDNIDSDTTPPPTTKNTKKKLVAKAKTAAEKKSTNAPLLTKPINVEEESKFSKDNMEILHASTSKHS
ncbi:hypothetical protein EJ02DRAFT_468790 [Clathrospora elynae]|uniref:Uncharacterized protein n=1 Tax=Clathrospora elynae TaxID=706981 RepID=A0A6A5SFG8_9PLEO|nr:hypothetical protein EJ02DRAFT_468790 [Clathrospora elynae]